MTQGWIKLHRQIQDHEFWCSERFTRGQAWIDLLLMANHERKTVFLRNQQVTIERGQVGHSIVTLTQKWKWNGRTVVRYLDMLESRGMITQHKTNVTTIITIQKYESFQSSTSLSTEQTTEQSASHLHSKVHTNKNDKKVKNEKKQYVVRPETEALRQTIESLCQQYVVRSEISPRGLDILVERYLNKVQMKVEVTHAITWLVSKNEQTGKDRACSTAFIGNWFKKKLEINKREELKNLEWKQAQNDPFIKAKINKMPPEERPAIQKKEEFAIDPDVKARLGFPPTP